MKISVARDVFTEAVSWVARTIPTRPAVPVLAGLKMVATDDGNVALGSRDSDITSHADIEAEVAEAGEVLVNGRLLADICKSLPNLPIKLCLEGSRLEIECGSAMFTLKTMVMADYQELPELTDVVGTVNGADWQEAVSQATIAASSDDTLPMLVSVCLEIEGDRITLLATDRYRLAAREVSWTPRQPDISMRILARATRLADVAKSLGTSGPIEITMNPEGPGGLIGMSAGSRRNTIQLIDGDYPQVRSLFPAEINGYATIDRAALLDAIKRSRLVVEKNSAVRLSFAEGEVVLEAGHGDNAQASEVLEAELNGEDIKMAFNPAFLQEGLMAMTGDSVRLAFTHPGKPAVMTSVNKDGEVDDDFRLLLMPIRTFGNA